MKLYFHIHLLHHITSDHNLFYFVLLVFLCLFLYLFCLCKDYTRTSTYQRAILQNIGDFKDKVKAFMLKAGHLSIKYKNKASKGLATL